MSKLPAAVSRYRDPVAEHLEAYLKQQAALPDRLGWQSDVAERLLHLATQGKLLRGSLVCYSYATCSNDQAIPPVVMRTAMSLELAQTSLLIHDDIMDQDELRRGQPALHRQYRHLFEQSSATRWGESLALCAGDMSLSMAFELLGSAESAEPIRLVGRELRKTCAGQMQDVCLAAQTKPPTKPVIFAMMRAKSAGYSIALPLTLGATLANMSDVLRRRLYALGLTIGTLFQIRDDELGMFGDPRRLGKPVGADIREGKKTLLHYYLWHAADFNERQQLRTIFGNPAVTAQDVKHVHDLLRTYNVAERLQADVERLRQTALRQLQALALPPQAQSELAQLVAFCAQREA